VRADCESAGCAVICGDDEIVLTAFCGPRREAAIFPTEHSASCHRHGPESHPLIAACAKFAAQAATAVARPTERIDAGAPDIPHLNVDAGCRATSDNNSASVATCLTDEQGAREKLAREWAQFAGATRRTARKCRPTSPAIKAMSSCSRAWKWRAMPESSPRTSRSNEVRPTGQSPAWPFISRHPAGAKPWSSSRSFI